ncbi:type III secretion system chaperone [Simkania negevensis]|uniref:Type III secretion system chaperone n=1 Tax=Simkania negevensis TaxID=83561 RepID=A0ABS3AS64_9BACT|nr:type III secretion system chaperone [Simkania negevensis]
MVFSEHVQKLSGELGVAFEPLEENAREFLVPVEKGEGGVVKVLDLSPGFSLSCSVVALPQKDLELFVMDVMGGNLFGQGTAGGVLSLDGAGKRLYLTRDVPGEVKYAEFRDVFEDFLNVVDFWRGEVEEHNKSG